ncbi:MAG: hypothetical protein A2201_03480 [Alicyclobacillus sp. RIFOXYA1_FULL_53_8]|nr:MAG: hypothetical protein A2201_03480 [Alicyclobacillus sp. RIFOXYA1_FULL_53_8]
MYELIILGFLMRAPIHGYLVTKIINDMIGPYAKLSSGRLYPLLAKMEEQGLISPVEHEGHAQTDGTEQTAERRHRVFAITEAGRVRFHRLMLDTTSNLGDYQRLFWLKVTYSDSIELSERLHLADHYMNYCQSHIFHIKSELVELQQQVEQHRVMSEEQFAATSFVMEHILRQWQNELDEVRNWRSLLAHPTHGPDH